MRPFNFDYIIIIILFRSFSVFALLCFYLSSLLLFCIRIRNALATSARKCYSYGLLITCKLTEEKNKKKIWISQNDEKWSWNTLKNCSFFFAFTFVLLLVHDRACFLHFSVFNFLFVASVVAFRFIRFFICHFRISFRTRGMCIFRFAMKIIITQFAYLFFLFFFYFFNENRRKYRMFISRPLCNVHIILCLFCT